MARILGAALLFCGAAVIIQAQPGIGQNGVANLASQIPPTLAGGAIARGALFSIRGIRFGTLEDTTVTLSAGNSTIPVMVTKVFSRRIEARMPENAPLGAASLIVTGAGQASRPFAVNIAASNPGIFSENGGGWGPGRIENIASSGARSPNTIQNPARPGSRISLVTTGLGNLRELHLMIGERPVRAVAPRHTTKPGEEEFTIAIPPGVPEGCYVPLYALITPERASNVVTLAIASKPGPCDPSPLPRAMAGKIASVVVTRSSTRPIRPGIPELIRDDARVLFIETVAKPTSLPIQLLPPAGTCTTLTSSYQTNTNLTSSLTSFLGLEGQGLDAGNALELSRAGDRRTLQQAWEGPGSYFGRLGAKGFSNSTESGNVGPGRFSLPLFLEPGQYVLRGTGGRDIGAFAAALMVPPPFEWTDREQTSTIDRSRGVTIHWKNAAPDQMMIVLLRNIDQITTAIGMTVCTARGSAGQLSIPAPVLANIPASQDVAGVPYEEVALSAVTLRPDLKVPGVTGGAEMYAFVLARFVKYR